MKRRKPRLSGLIAVGALLLSSRFIWSADAFGKSEDPSKKPRLIIVFVDMSGSSSEARRTVCKEAFEKIYQNLRQGDRVVVGTITGRSYIEFEPTVDVEIPKKSIWDNRLQFEKKLANAKEKIRGETDKLLSRERGTMLTEIMDSLNIAQIVFHDEKERQKILVLLSDMIEDSQGYNFEKDRISDEYIDKVIRDRQRGKLIPNLAGVKVYVAGASAADSNKFREIQKFWAGYFAKTGADFSPDRYGHSLINFENGSSKK